MSQLHQLEKNLEAFYEIQDLVSADIVMTNDLLQSYVRTTKFPFQYSKEITELMRFLEKSKKVSNDLDFKINHIIQYKSSLLGSYSDSLAVFIEY
jgi:hypothetical protein